LHNYIIFILEIVVLRIDKIFGYVVYGVYYVSNEGD
jgi:hypothetical protein